MAQPWESEAAFSTEHWRATQAQKAGDDSLMDLLVARMKALETAVYGGECERAGYVERRQ